MWLNDSLSYNKKDRKVSEMIRIMSYKFLKEECIAYLYSKEKKFDNILKYRNLLLKFL